MFFIFYISTACLNYFKTSLVFGAVICAFVTHHTRDAVHRGYWLCPFGRTERIPYLYYIFTTILIPYICFYLHSICRSNSVQHFLGNYIKLQDNYRVGTGGYRYATV